MSSTAETIVPLDRKEQFQKTPIYVAISPTDVATIWKFQDSHAYFVAGKYLGLATEGEKVKGQRYRKLGEHEKNVVADAVKLQDREAVLRFDLD